MLAGTHSYAQEKVIPMTKGDIAPYSGIFFPKDKAKELRQINEEKKLLEKKVLKLEDLQIIQEETSTFYKENYYKTKNLLEAEQTKSFWKSTLYFFGGVLITGIITSATLKYAK